MTATISTLIPLYEDYLSAARCLQRSADRPANLLSRLLGSGKNPGDPTLNPQFIEAVRKHVLDFAGSAPSSAEAADYLRYVWRQTEENQDCGVAKWALCAAESVLTPLLPFLTPADAAALAESYAARRPRRDRFPAQDAFLCALTEKGHPADQST